MKAVNSVTKTERGLFFCWRRLMRCYFHFVNGREAVQYDTAVEVSDVGKMQRLAQHVIHKLRVEADRVNEEWRGWRLNVVHESGSVLLSMSLDSPLQYEQPILAQ
jgi:hypothetical protein